MIKSVFVWQKFAANQFAKLWSRSLIKVLMMVFFRQNGKKPVYKKDDKQCLTNYRLVSMLPFCGKVPERLKSDEIFRFPIETN